MNLNLTSIEKDGLVRVAAKGQITAKDLPDDDSNPFSKVIGEQWASNKVLLSLEEADFLDSSAIGWLLTSQKQFSEAGGKMVLHSVPSSVRQILDMLRVESILPMAVDETAARKILNAKESKK